MISVESGTREMLARISMLGIFLPHTPSTRAATDVPRVLELEDVKIATCFDLSTRYPASSTGAARAVTYQGTSAEEKSPYCPQPPRPTYPIVAPDRPWLEEPGVDELECLNLNISVPRRPSEHSGKVAGDSALPWRHDLDRPTVVVTLNYRLGPFGFLAGRDIQSYNAGKGDTGVGNYGIWDQVLALRWVKSHIAGFGGDPDQVTLFGQSAGGVSINCHMLRDERLFSAAIIQSGMINLCGVFTIDQYQTIYRKILDNLAIKASLSPSKRLQQLLAVSSERLLASGAEVLQVPCETWRLCNDHVLLPRALPTYHDYDKFFVPEWVKGVLIGDCAHEAIIWADPYEDKTAAELLHRMKAESPDIETRIADSYGIRSETVQQEAFRRFEKMTTDGMYLIPNYFAAKKASKAFTYHFDVRQPWKGTKWSGLAHHSFDNVLVWSILKHTLPEAQQRISEQMSAAFIKFANGEDPWEKFGNRGRSMIIEESGMIMRTEEEDWDRGYATWHALHEEGLVGALGMISEDMCLKNREVLAADHAHNAH